MKISARRRSLSSQHFSAPDLSRALDDPPYCISKLPGRTTPLPRQPARMAQIRRVYDVGGSGRSPRRDLRPTEHFEATRTDDSLDEATRTHGSNPARSAQRRWQSLRCAEVFALPLTYSRRAMISSYEVAENQRRQAAVAAEVSSTMVFGRAGSRSAGGFCRQLKQIVFPIRSKN